MSTAGPNQPGEISSATGYPPGVSSKAKPAQKAAAKTAWQRYVDDAERGQHEQRDRVRASLLIDLTADHPKAA